MMNMKPILLILIVVIIVIATVAIFLTIRSHQRLDDNILMELVYWSGGGGRFGPNDNITREQMAVILSNYARVMGYELPSTRAGSFNDETQMSTWALQSVNALFEAGIIIGRGEGNFVPQGNATRAEVAALLHNFMGVI